MIEREKKLFHVEKTAQTLEKCKLFLHFTDTLSMKLFCKRHDGEKFEVEANEVREIIPCENLFLSSYLVDAFTALISYRGEIFPIRGPIPVCEPHKAWQEKYGWILIFEKHGEVVADLPLMEAPRAEEDINTTESVTATSAA